MKLLSPPSSYPLFWRGFLAVAGLLAFVATSSAQNWNGGTDTSWGTAGNWTGTAPVSSGTLDLNFNTANLTGAANMSADNNLTAFIASSMTFANTLGGERFTLTGNQITLGGNVNVSGLAGNPGPLIGLNLALSATRNITVAAGASAEISGMISGANGLNKLGAGALTLSGSNTFSGPLLLSDGGTVTFGHNSAGGTGTITVQDTGSALLLANGVSVANNITISNTGNLKTLGLQSGATSASFTGNLNFVESTGGDAVFQAQSGGVLNVSGNISGTGFFATGRGMTVISGINTQTNTSGVFLGTLRLDYSTNNTSKLSDSGALTLGGTVNLAGGSHNEVVNGWSLRPGASAITLSSGASTISLGLVSFGASSQGGTVNFGSASLATVTQNATFSTAPTGWATMAGTDWAVTSGTGTGVAVVAFSAYTSVVGGGTMTNSPDSHNLLSNGGTIALAGATTSSIGTALLKSSNDATINTTGKTMEARGLMIAAGGGNLTVGSSPNSGNLTRVGTGNTTQLNLINYSSNKLLINSVIVDKTGSVVPFVTKSGQGLVELAANNTYTGPTYANEGTLLISGSNSGNGAYEVRGNLMVNGSIGTGAVTVFEASVLGGEGTINGVVTMQQGAKLSAGYNSADTLTLTNGLNLSATAGSAGVFAFTLGSTPDLVDVTGGILNLGDHQLNFSSFNFTLGVGITETVYTLFNSVSTTGSLAYDNLSGSLGGGYSGTLGLSGNDVILTVVPEPNAALLLGAAGAFLWLGRFRRSLRRNT